MQHEAKQSAIFVTKTSIKSCILSYGVLSVLLYFTLTNLKVSKNSCLVTLIKLIK